jgi:hypothetical protein
MLGWCLAYVCASIGFGVYLGALGYRHRVWSRTDLRRGMTQLLRELAH